MSGEVREYQQRTPLGFEAPLYNAWRLVSVTVEQGGVRVLMAQACVFPGWQVGEHTAQAKAMRA